MSLPIYVIYQSPSDYPGKFVTRLWKGPKPQQEPEVVADTLEEARAAVPQGLYRMQRAQSDDPVIVESWL